LMPGNRLALEWLLPEMAQNQQMPVTCVQALAEQRNAHASCGNFAQAAISIGGYTQSPFGNVAADLGVPTCGAPVTAPASAALQAYTGLSASSAAPTVPGETYQPAQASDASAKSSSFALSDLQTSSLHPSHEIAALEGCTPRSMELQIRELLATQRSIRKKLKGIQQRVDDNSAELDGLRIVAGHLHEFMGTGQIRGGNPYQQAEQLMAAQAASQRAARVPQVATQSTSGALNVHQNLIGDSQSIEHNEGALQHRARARSEDG